MIDKDLSPDIAAALGLFDFDITHVERVSQFQNRPEGVGGPEIIAWCEDNDRMWVTHDIKAKKKHKVDLRTTLISVLWMRGHPEQFAT